MSTEQRPIVFIVMPFARAFDNVFRILVQSLEGYDVIRADSHLNQQNILKSIAEGIDQADLIIADVTETNANVMYELGAAHALGKPTVMIAQSISSLPFDVRSYPVQVYDPNAAQVSDFAQRLREIGTRHAARQLRFGNPITDFLPKYSRRTESLEELARDDAPIELPEADYGYLDFSADMEEYGGQTLSQFTRLGELNSQLTERIRDLAPAMQQARASRSAKHERTVTNHLASLLQTYAGTLRREILPEFHQGWAGVGHAMHWMASQKPDDAPSAATDDFCAQERGLRDVLASIISKVIDVRDSVVGGRGRTAQLEKAIRETETAFSDLIGEVMIADAVLAKVHERLGCPQPASAEVPLRTHGSYTREGVD